MLEIDIENANKLPLGAGENIHFYLKDFGKCFKIEKLTKYPPYNSQHYRVVVNFIYKTKTKIILLDVNENDDIIDYIYFPKNEGIIPQIRGINLLSLNKKEVIALTTKHSLGISVGKDRIEFMALNIGFHFESDCKESAMPENIYLYNLDRYRPKIYRFVKRIKNALKFPFIMLTK